MFKPCFLIRFYTFCQKGEIFLKKKYYLIQKIGERNLYGLGLNLTVRVQTDDHGPMSYERPYHMKFLFISNFTHAILPIVFAVHT